MSPAATVDRERVLAYRVRAHGLDRAGGPPAELPVAALGLPEMPAGSAALALAARTPPGTGGGPAEGGPAVSGPTEGAPTEDGPTVSGPAEGPAAARTDGGPTSGGRTERGPTGGEPAEGRRAEGGPTWSGPGEGPAGPAEPDWTLAWTVRGAPHWHRTGDLPGLAAALWPADAGDAGARLAGAGPALRAAGEDPLEALRVTAEALHEVVAAPATKGEASAALTERLPGAYSTWCRTCGATHVYEQLMRLAGLPAGLRLTPGASPPVLVRVPGWPGVPGRQDGLGAYADAYLRVQGPAGPGEVAAHLQTTARAVRPAWPDGLVEVRVDGRRAWLSEDRLDALLGAPPPRLVRLLPRSDPWLQARDRTLLVPDKARHREVWQVIGSPGAVLVDGEIEGTWRMRLAGRRLDVTVRPFVPLAPPVRRAVEEEAARVAAVRGAADARVAYEE